MKMKREKRGTEIWNYSSAVQKLISEEENRDENCFSNLEKLISILHKTKQKFMKHYESQKMFCSQLNTSWDSIYPFSFILNLIPF